MSEHNGHASLLALDSQTRAVLEGWAASRSMDPRIAQRCRIILVLADGLTTSGVARTLRTTRATVRVWHDRFRREGLDGLLRDKPGRGRKPVVDPLVWRSIDGFAGPGPVPNTRELADTFGISMATVARWRRRLKSEELGGR
jgi:DNA-binding transcriptional regulator YiaG